MSALREHYRALSRKGDAQAASVVQLIDEHDGLRLRVKAKDEALRVMKVWLEASAAILKDCEKALL